MSYGSRIIASQVNGHTFTVSDRYDFSTSKILGRGTYGVVATAFDTHANRTIAIKRIRPFANDDWDARHTLREIRLLRVLGPHPNIISLYNLSSHEEKAELYMMMELMDCDLHRVIQSKQVLTPKHIKCFLKQILEGIRAMHDVGVFHRDLKPGNILVSKDCQVRITDFGLARFMDEATRQGTNKLNPMTEYVVTRWYRAPELLLSPGGTYDEAIDLWSIGCIFAELLRRRPLFPGKSHAHQVQLIFELLGYDAENLGFSVTVEAARYLDKRSMSFSSNATTLRQAVGNDAPDEAIDLLEQLLTVNPNYRCSAALALQCNFLRGADLLCDYSRNYIRRPQLEDFDFEQEKYSLEELKTMILDEIRYYKRRPSNTITTDSSPQLNSSQNSSGWSETNVGGIESDENYYRSSAGSREGTLSREGTVSRENTVTRDRTSTGSYMDEGPSSQMNTSVRTLGSKRNMESMLAGENGMTSSSSGNNSISRPFRGTAVGNIIASARSMNASSPTPRQAVTPSKQQIAATLYKENKARYRQNSNGNLGPLGEVNGGITGGITGTTRFPTRVPPLANGPKGLNDSLSSTGNVFSNIQAYQSLSARGQSTENPNPNSNLSSQAVLAERKVFTAPSFQFPIPFGVPSNATTPTSSITSSIATSLASSLASTANPIVFNGGTMSNSGNFNGTTSGGMGMGGGMTGGMTANLNESINKDDMNSMDMRQMRASLESKPLAKTASWRQSNGRSMRR